MTELDETAFGGSPNEADALVALVIAGRKTGTCWAARHGELTHVGRRVILRDSGGRARAILETVSLELRRFCDMDEAWAEAEGEGDLSLAYWQRTHQTFFEQEGLFEEEMDLWCERFRLVDVVAQDD